MAKVLYTAFMADMRNKINGSVFSKNRYGNFVRTKVSPTNAQTAFQSAARSLLSFFSSNWRTLRDAQQQGWINASLSFPFTDVFGNTRYLSGQTLYVKLNCNLNLIGQPQIDDAPSPTGLPIIAISSVDATTLVPSFNITLVDDTGLSGTSLLIYATPPVSTGRSYVKGMFKLLGVGTSVSDIIDIEALYSARYAAVVTGEKIYVKVVVVNNTTGQASPPITGFAVATA